MRIIAGLSKGFLLKAPKGLDVRPTADRVKETIFNILRDRVENSTILDLFAGTGNLGLEALSRGAAAVTFFDNSRRSLAIVKENVAHTHWENFCELHKTDALLGLAFLKKNHRNFDLIFCDPPYNRNLVGKVLTSLDEPAGILASEGIVIIEHSRHESWPDSLEYLKVWRTEKFGETLISFITRKVAEE